MNRYIAWYKIHTKVLCWSKCEMKTKMTSKHWTEEGEWGREMDEDGIRRKGRGRTKIEG